MNNQKRYNSVNEFFTQKFGERVSKICIDGNFSCPNRDGTKGVGGCAYCGERGAGENTDGQICIKEQVLNYLSSYKNERANKFVAYFQNFSNTYDKVSVLKQKYDSALIDNRIIGLSIASRPDCINEEVARLLSEYAKKYYVWVELGLQTANDDTKSKLNINYTNQDFTNAVKILRSYDIDVVCHIMIGLPGENNNDLINTVDFINKQNINGVKIHSTYIIKNTKLETMYDNGSYIPLKYDDYINQVIYTIRHLNPKFVIHRFTGDAPKDLLIAPEWNYHKKRVMNKINNELIRLNTFQGELYD